MVPVRKDAGSLALCMYGAGNVQSPSQALQKRIVDSVDLAALGTYTDIFIQDTNTFLPDTPLSQRLPVLHSLHSCCCTAQLFCKFTLCQPLN